MFPAGGLGATLPDYQALLRQHQLQKQLKRQAKAAARQAKAEQQLHALGQEPAKPREEGEDEEIGDSLDGDCFNTVSDGALCDGAPSRGPRAG